MRTEAGAAPVLAGEPGRRSAAERLRQAILAGHMAPGQRLVEEELAGMLGVDPSTLRRWRTARPRQGPPFVLFPAG